LAIIDKTIGEGFGTGKLYDILKWQNGVPCDAEFTIGSESNDTISVNVQFLDWNGDPLTNPTGILAYVSTSADGCSVDGIGSNGQSLAISSGGDGTLLELVNKKLYWLVPSSSGSIDIDFSDTGDATYYLVLVLPNGKLAISDAITFTA